MRIEFSLNNHCEFDSLAMSRNIQIGDGHWFKSLLVD